MSNQKIHVIITGGTIDSAWDAARDTAVARGESIVPVYLDKLKLDIDFTYKTVCMKDSRALTPDDLKAINEATEDVPGGGRVLITHGTYTMPDTARYIQARLQDKSKRIVLTGSLVPLEGYTLSDASFNLGFSIATLLSMEPGILLCMQAHLFRPEEVAKNMSEARFFSIEQ